MPSADMTERWRSGSESGAGTLNGKDGATAAAVVMASEAQPETQQVASTHLKSAASSSQSPVVSYILTPSPVTAAGNHWKSRSPTPLPASKKGTEGPTKRQARFDDTAMTTSGCKMRLTLSGNVSFARLKETTDVLSSHNFATGRCIAGGKAAEQATPRKLAALVRIHARRIASVAGTTSCLDVWASFLGSLETAAASPVLAGLGASLDVRGDVLPAVQGD
mmetsp:Transcript_40289/g.110912  ORF Transcript_40289/g.110912 Transcript_40289/m.110912 type:complete len:221 (+) Transcript_40289:576-1238(+)